MLWPQLLDRRRKVAPIGHVARRTVVIVKILSHLGLPTRGPPRAPARRVELFQTSEEPKAACQRRRRRALRSTERLHKKPFACLPTALRPSGPVQQRIFHQAEKELTSLTVLRYGGH